MSRTESELLAEALVHLEVAQAYGRRGDAADQMVIDAVSMRLASGIESLSKLDGALRYVATGGHHPAVGATHKTRRGLDVHPQPSVTVIHHASDAHRRQPSQIWQEPHTSAGHKEVDSGTVEVLGDPRG